MPDVYLSISGADQPVLPDARRTQLDGIVSKMQANGGVGRRH